MRDMHDFYGFDKTTDITNSKEMMEIYAKKYPSEVKSYKYTTQAPHHMYNQGMGQAVWQHFFMMIIFALVISFLLSGTMFFISQLRKNKK